MLPPILLWTAASLGQGRQYHQKVFHGATLRSRRKEPMHLELNYTLIEVEYVKESKSLARSLACSNAAQGNQSNRSS